MKYDLSIIDGTTGEIKYLTWDEYFKWKSSMFAKERMLAYKNYKEYQKENK